MQNVYRQCSFRRFVVAFSIMLGSPLTYPTLPALPNVLFNLLIFHFLLQISFILRWVNDIHLGLAILSLS